ncbi:hypothetical protein B6D60_05730 [candidate division KSB1 bacterium 4484_87]|nr:MAG: hypothetical protein B6D60_05730 [candidate division KSB1 bacterium 4484_87]
MKNSIEMTNLTPLTDRFRTVAEKEKYVIDLFSKIDHNYDPMNRLMSLGRDLSWRRKAVRLANFSREGLLLDVAAGTGDLTLSAFRQFPEAHIVGIDFCLPLLKIATEKISRTNKKFKVAWVMGNGLRLPFPDNSVDGVMTAFSLRNVADVRGFFEEFYRVTRPGGKVVSLEMVRPVHSLQKIIFSIHQKTMVPAVGKLFSAYPDAYSYLPLSIENFYSANELVKEISAAGWKNVRFKSMMFGFVAAHVAEK